MSSGNFGSTVDLRLRPAAKALMLALWIHALPAALLPFAMQPGWVMVALAGLIALSWVGLRHHPVLGHSKRSITRILWDAEGHWTIWCQPRPDGEGEKAELLANSIIHPHLLLLRFRVERKGRQRVVSRLILGDETAAEPLRRLRARLSVQ